MINEALDVIEAAGGRFTVASCQVGQSSHATSSAELHVAADTAEQLAEIVEALAEVAGVFFPKLPPAIRALTRSGTIEKARQRQRSWNALHSAERRSMSPSPRMKPGGFRTEEEEPEDPAAESGHPTDNGHAGTTGVAPSEHEASQRAGSERAASDGNATTGLPRVLLLGAGRMCEPVVRHLTAVGKSGACARDLSIANGDAAGESGNGPAEQKGMAGRHESGLEEWRGAQVTVASLLLDEAQRAAAIGKQRCHAVQLDTRDTARLAGLVCDSDVVISLLPPACHVAVALACIAAGKDLVTASYVSGEMQALDGAAKAAGVTLLCEMGLDPGIGEGHAPAGQPLACRREAGAALV